jgi:ABC-type transport system involved in cytochrome c biogenesis permease subunit
VVFKQLLFPLRITLRSRMMWSKPWNMKEGFLIGGGLILAGLALQLSVGPVAWDAFAWPANGIALAGFMVMLTAMAYLRRKVYAFQFAGTYQAAIPAMVYAIVLTIIMGLTRQQVNGTWLNNMLSFWPFVLIYVYIAVILGLTIHRRLRKIIRGQWAMKRDIPFLLNHLGLFIALTTATLGSADMQRVKMICGVGEPEWRVLDKEGTIKEMPIAIELKKFIMETYDDGKPKRFASEIQILTKSGKNIETTVDVNKPYEVDGWIIYQYGYDTQMGAQSQISILELVRDPWLPWVYTGIYMMLAGSLLLVAYTHWRMKRLLPIGALLVVALAIVSYLMPIVRSDTLVPALQSPWFFPHILIYIVCYSLMGVAAVMSAWMLLSSKFFDKRSGHPTFGRLLPAKNLGGLDNLIYIGLIFMTFGMMFGAFWAKEAWGHYWSWDPKETWAAITWLAYLVYLHYRQLTHRHVHLALWMLIGSFVLLQMCWWGINYLPSAQGSSVHTYSSSK